MNPGMFMTGMPMGGGMPPVGMGAFATGVPPAMGGFNAGPFATSQPPFNSVFGGPAFTSNLPLNGPGPSIESFQKDGFKIMGREPVKVKNDEGTREFAELFSLADTKIKDRAHEKPKYDLTYNPIAHQQQQSVPQSMPLGMPQSIPQQRHQEQPAPLQMNGNNFM